MLFSEGKRPPFGVRGSRGNSVAGDCRQTGHSFGGSGSIQTWKKNRSQSMKLVKRTGQVLWEVYVDWSRRQ